MVSLFVVFLESAPVSPRDNLRNTHSRVLLSLVLSVAIKHTLQLVSCHLNFLVDWLMAPFK